MLKIKPAIKDKRIRVVMLSHSNSKTYVEYFNCGNSTEAFQRVVHWNAVCNSTDKPCIMIEEGNLWLN